MIQLAWRRYSYPQPNRSGDTCRWIEFDSDKLLAFPRMIS